MYMFLFWQILISWTNSFPKFSWVRDFTTKNQEFATKLGFSLYTIKDKNMIKKNIIILIATGLIASFLSCNQNKENKEQKSLTQVLVVGTTHAHDRNPNYTFYDLINILGTYDPDVICVEIPKSYFRKRSYLYEMILATIYGNDNNKKVYPIDSWTSATGGDDRAKRREYIKTEEYKVKEKQYYDLVDSSLIMQNFNKQHESLDKLWNKHDKGYEFFNGAEYNDYIREMYAINVSVFGDGCMNLSYLTRNEKMLELINSSINENKGRKIIVLTGAEHKHYFDIELSKNDSLNLIDFKDILPLKKQEVSRNVSDFIEKKLAKGYYYASDSSAIDLMYQGALVELIHGMGMDDNPDIVPAENIEKAKPIIDEWEKQNSQSVCLQFEKAWIGFLEGDYKQAATILESIEDKLDETPESSQWFVKPFYWRNLGFCYDMMNERKKAINAYKQCKIVCLELGRDENSSKKWVYKNYDTKPFERKIK